MCTLVKELAWVRNLAIEIGIIDMGPTTVFCDNQSAIRLAEDEGSVQRTRHMGVRAAFVREAIQNRDIEVKHIGTDDQAADFLTKPLTTAKFVWNRSLLMTLTILFMLTTGVSSMTFEATSPIIWLPTNNFVDAGVTEYEVQLTLLNPCEALKDHFLPRNTMSGPVKRQYPPLVPYPPPFSPMPQQQQPQLQQQQIPTNTIISHQQQVDANAVLIPAQDHVDDGMQQSVAEYIVGECSNMWNQIFMSKINELKTRSPRYRDGPVNHVKTRSIADAVETTAELVCAGCVTNLISTLFERLYPHSDHNRIKALEEHKQELDAQVNEFNQKFNITNEIHKGILESMINFRRYQHEMHHQIQHLAYLMPRVSWTSAYIQARITAGAQDIRTIIEEYSYGRVACKEMASLLNIKELEDIDNHDTNFEFIRRSGSNSFVFKFAVRNRALNTRVYKVSAFKYWDNLTGVPKLMEYRGYNYLIHNETANCLKAIEEPSQRAILEVCNEANYTDPRLNIWEMLVETRDVYRFNHTCQVKRTLVYNYIYCFPFNITTKMGIFRNPPHVYRLPLSEAFELPMTKYVPVVRKLNITGSFEFPAIDSIHMGLFPMGSEAIDEIKWFDKMQMLMKENEKLINQRDRSVSIEKQGGMFWFLIALTVILVLTTAGLITYNIHLSQQSTHHHRRMAKDIMELKSNYCEVIRPDSPTCTEDKTATISSVARKKEKSISVGNDASVTINLNRPLPTRPPSL